MPWAPSTSTGILYACAVSIIFFTGTIVPRAFETCVTATSFVLGDNWARNVVLPTHTVEETPQEGLLAALSRVAPDRFPRIALVDDSIDARRLIRRILQSQGNFTIYEADSGKQALKIIAKECPDLIILDLMMPEMDGWEVFDKIKTSQRIREVLQRNDPDLLRPEYTLHGAP
jgi:CheY-like chemotaxis protein